MVGQLSKLPKKPAIASLLEVFDQLHMWRMHTKIMLSQLAHFHGAYKSTILCEPAAPNSKTN
jgi:hypothetical protein